MNRQVFEERIASYRKTFQEHKGYYLQNPLAEKLLLLQAEKEEIECRIKAWDEQISMKQKKLDHLTGDKPFNFFLFCSGRAENFTACYTVL